ncbi:MAG: hypothetical protein OXN83_02195 [Oligoflexia bacterium]|nr:hypothetical protein [Oligoflexia bacterium]
MTQQSASVFQKHFLSVKPDNSNILINGLPLYLYEKSILKVLPTSSSEYLPQHINTQEIIPLNYSENELFSPTVITPFVIGEKPLTELINRIYNIYHKHQRENWDGYGAEPIQYLSQSRQFAKALFLEARTLIESLEIIPENDGCLCFEWFKSSNKYITISVKGNILIYTYKFGNNRRGCGEATFSDKQIPSFLIEKIKTVI